MKKVSKNKVWQAVFGSFLSIIGVLVAIGASMLGSTGVMAVDGDTTEPVYLEEIVDNEESAEAEDNSEVDGENSEDTEDNAEDGAENSSNTGTTAAINNPASCEASLGGLGWQACPLTSKISEAVDWLYDKIEPVLAINPAKVEDGEPIYEVWKYFRGVTNIVFIIFLLVVIYSQITGYGISNYGIKKALPKLIVVAILVNLSYYMCSLLVDASNIIGNGLRGVFETIEAATLGEMNINGVSSVSMAEIYSALSGGVALAIGAGVVAFETGAIWMLIPVALGAIVAVATGLITIAMRQAVVALLIMISPLAIVAYMLPNTEQLFQKWKKLLTRMLVFYPMFSLLFGASSLAGWAIIASAKDGFMLLLGVAVQIFPLFFSWSLMRLSGTFLEGINTRMRGWTAGALASNRAWADSHRQATKARQLASGNAYTPSLRLQQFLSNRRIAREADTKENLDAVQQRGLAYGAQRHYRKDGTVSRDGEEAYARQARVMGYQRTILRDKNNFEKGLGQIAGGSRNAVQKARLNALDVANVNASDYLKIEQARTEKITYDNATGFHKRMEDAVNSHFDQQNAGNSNYKIHDIADRAAAEGRYAEAMNIMEGNNLEVQFAAAAAAHNYDTQAKIVMTKMQKYFELTPPTKDLEYRMKEFSTSRKAVDNIDMIISGLREINRRGDTDIVKDILDDVVDEGVHVGTHASQSLASFLMLDVKDSDPFLRRFGKYINLETARAYNKNDRKNTRITFDEYVKGYHEEPDGTIMYAKKPMSVLLEGTSFDGVERTAYMNIEDSLKKVYTDAQGNLDVDGYLKKSEELHKAIGPQFISASLKYLSGSEQLRSAVRFMTGYNYTQKKDENGNMVVDDDGNPVYDWERAWDTDKLKEEDREKLHKYYRGRAEKYIKDQTPTQILGFRSDYKTPILELMAESWVLHGVDGADESDEAIAERKRIYEQELAAARAAGGNSGAEDYLIKGVSGARFRDILDKSGKLGQIYASKRSGAANNAKDWMRGLLKLDDPVAIKKYEDELLRRFKEQQMEKGGEGAAYDANGRPIYDESVVEGFKAHVDDLAKDYDNADADGFYEASSQWLNGVLNGSIIAWFYKQYYEAEQGSGLMTRDYLRNYLKDMLDDPTKYY